MRLVIAIFLFLGIVFCGESQNEHVACTHGELDAHYKNAPVYHQSLRVVKPSTPSDTSTLLRIPVVFNVIHMGEPRGVGTNVSDIQLLNAIEYLNTYYQKKYNPYSYQSTFKYEGTKGKNTKLEFYLATLDTNCSYFSGIRRIDGTQFPNYVSEGIKYGNDLELKEKTGLDVDRYLNIWIVNKIDANGQGVVGYAYYPSAYGRVKGFGCVISHNNINGILPHEIGHFLGLTHNDMAIGKYTNEHSYKIIRQSVELYKTKELTEKFNCVPKYENDAAIVSIYDLPEHACEGKITPKISLSNYGKNTLEKALFKVKMNGIFLQYFNWEGALSSFDTITIPIPEIEFEKGAYDVSVELVKINDVSDPVYSNNIQTKRIAIAGNIGELPFQEDFNTFHNSNLSLLKGDRSNTSIQYLNILKNSHILLLEGVDTENKSYLGELPYNALNPWSDLNRSYLASSSFCFNAEKGKHYKLSFDRYQDVWGSAHFRVLANGKQVKEASSLRNTEWKRDSVVISSKEEQKVLVALQSSCDYAYETTFKQGYGSYIAIDDLLLEKTETHPFEFGFEFTGNAKGCAPLDRIPENKSFGVPYPIEYQYLVDKGNSLYDTIIQLDIPGHFKFTEEGIFGVHVIAVFEDGTQDSIYYSRLANTIKEEVFLQTEEDPNGDNAWITSETTINTVFWSTSELNSNGGTRPSHLLNYLNQQTENSDLVFSMQSVPFNFKNLDNVLFHFNYAYTAPNLEIAKREYLSIKVSADCGQTWSEVYHKQGNELVTSEYDPIFHDVLFKPTLSDWGNVTIPLDTLAHKDNVLIKFDFHPSYGNSLYLDKITIEDSGVITSNTERNSNFHLTLFPNPVTQYLIIEGGNHISKTVVKNMAAVSIKEFGETNTIDVSNLESGVYLAEIHHDNLVDVVKFLKK